MSTIKLPPLPEVRWNFDASETSLLVCRDDHDKGEKCEYEELHPAEALRVIDTLRSRVLQLEADRAQRGEPVAWRAWFDKDSGARWLFSLWPDEENKGLEVDWQPLYTAPQPERKPTTDAQCIELFHKVQRGMGFKDHDVIPFISGVAAGEHFHGIKETP